MIGLFADLNQTVPQHFFETKILWIQWVSKTDRMLIKTWWKKKPFSVNFWKGKSRQPSPLFQYARSFLVCDKTVFTWENIFELQQQAFFLHTSYAQKVEVVHKTQHDWLKSVTTHRADRHQTQKQESGHKE